MTWVELNEAEQRLARYVARRRNESNAERGTTNCRRAADATDEELNLRGIGAELALCKLLNVYPDLEIGVSPPFDAIARDGTTIDVKATRLPTGSLLALPWKRGKGADVYALLVGDFPRYRVAGIMRAEELLTPGRLTDLGHGPTYAAPQAELDDWQKVAA